jgi:hypothetical protein
MFSAFTFMKTLTTNKRTLIPRIFGKIIRRNINESLPNRRKHNPNMNNGSEMLNSQKCSLANVDSPAFGNNT